MKILLRSADLGSAFRAELSSVELVSAVGAELDGPVRRGLFLAAVGAELGVVACSAFALPIAFGKDFFRVVILEGLVVDHLCARDGTKKLLCLLFIGSEKI